MWLGLTGCASTPAPLAAAAAEIPTATDPTMAGAAVVESAAPLPEPPALNLRCQTDADCTVKNIGNCCGFLPACVNKASPTAPDLVLARCAASGEEPICDHPMIYACLCEQGICRADPSVSARRPARRARS
ncbi:MAG: hypothetical protein MUE46_20825 [Xanthomonadales bacterium]|nr:hypothetical protein [Xanthomonadales bacterium]